MESLKSWARTVYLVAVISSAALLMIPKSMQKQSKFVIELLLLLCIVVPPVGLVGKSHEVAGIRWDYADLAPEDFSLERFYASEVQRRAVQMGLAAGLRIHSVEVEARGIAPDFSGTKVYVYLTGPIDESEAEVIQKFRELLATHLGIDPKHICFEQLQE
ncbi:MAG: hypothetical protein ACOX35_01270 [Bacillota bacterium]